MRYSGFRFLPVLLSVGRERRFREGKPRSGREEQFCQASLLFSVHFPQTQRNAKHIRFVSDTDENDGTNRKRCSQSVVEELKRSDFGNARSRVGIVWAFSGPCRFHDGFAILEPRIGNPIQPNPLFDIFQQRIAWVLKLLLRVSDTDSESFHVTSASFGASGSQRRGGTRHLRVRKQSRSQMSRPNLRNG